MGETCARVVAAALLIGAISTVVGLAALVKTPRETGAPLSAPPSSLQRGVRLTVRLVPMHHRSPQRLVTTHTSQARPEVVSRSLVVVRRHPARRPVRQRQLAATTPAPQTTPTPAPDATPTDASAQPPAPTPVASPPSGPAGEEQDEGPGHGHGHGHAYGHEHQDD